MTREEKYDMVNQTKSLNELARVILAFTNVDGMIQGKTRKFDAQQCAQNCLNYNLSIHNSLTREFGIRQQAMMLYIYEELERDTLNSFAYQLLEALKELE